MKTSPLKTLAFAAFLFGISLLSACTATVRTAPPPVQTEVIPVAPGPRYAWVPGRHVRRGRSYVWQPGYYQAAPRAGRVYTQGYWRQGPRGYRWVPGRWR
ncbi:MAG: YXWGXW repeat-containing protein [Sphingobacteriaceae bacterium]|nr:YXWGXW repeat-containing protein [Cytophagaceae bacterium]